MPRINVPFIVQKQTLIQKPRVELISGGQNYFYAVFKFCSAWDGIESVRAVFSTDGVEPKLMPLERCGDHWECRIPEEVMPKNGIFNVGVVGGDRLPTNNACVKTRVGCTGEGSEPSAPTPDWFDVMEGLVKGIPDDIATAFAQAKADGEFKGDPGKTPIKGVDYFTQADISEMVAAVMEAMPNGDEEAY